MNFLLGCAVWSHKDWVGELFPAGSRSRDFLSLYSRRFTTVEGNTTFYAVPDADTVRRWAAETPEGFEFCLKLPRDITHQGSLTRAIPEALRFYDRMQPLGTRLGPMFVQLPPSYSPAQLDDLAVFLQAWQQTNTRLAVEVRHRAWFSAPHSHNLDRLLRDFGCGRVLLDSRPIYQDAQADFERRKPNLPLAASVTADFSLIRFASHPDRDRNQPFLEDWADRLHEWLGQTRVYFYIHCPIEARSPANASLVQQVLEQRGVPVPPLPWNQLDAAPAQLNLF